MGFGALGQWIACCIALDNGIDNVFVILVVWMIVCCIGNWILLQSILIIFGRFIRSFCNGISMLLSHGIGAFKHWIDGGIASDNRIGNTFEVCVVMKREK